MLQEKAEGKEKNRNSPEETEKEWSKTKNKALERYEKMPHLWNTIRMLFVEIINIL